MKLVFAIVQDADAAHLIRRLSEQAFEVTKLASTGGFLREGNTTLLMGIDEERLDDLKRLVRQVCRTRTRLVSPGIALSEQAEPLLNQPIEVPVGGAVLFVLSIEEFVKV